MCNFYRFIPKKKWMYRTKVWERGGNANELFGTVVYVSFEIAFAHELYALYAFYCCTFCRKMHSLFSCIYWLNLWAFQLIFSTCTLQMWLRKYCENFENVTCESSVDCFISDATNYSYLHYDILVTSNDDLS